MPKKVPNRNHQDLPTKLPLSIETSLKEKISNKQESSKQKDQDKPCQLSQFWHITQETSNKTLKIHNKFNILKKTETEENLQPCKHKLNKTENTQNYKI